MLELVAVVQVPREQTRPLPHSLSLAQSLQTPAAQTFPNCGHGLLAVVQVIGAFGSGGAAGGVGAAGGAGGVGGGLLAPLFTGDVEAGVSAQIPPSQNFPAPHSAVVTQPLEVGAWVGVTGCGVEARSPPQATRAKATKVGMSLCTTVSPLRVEQHLTYTVWLCRTISP